MATLGIPRLSYYTYKLMVETLEGSDWDNIETIINGTDHVYAYKFTQKDTGEPIWVIWWDYYDDTGVSSKQVNLSVGNMGTVQITEAVPDTNSGADLDENDYPFFFKTETEKVVNELVYTFNAYNPTPVYISLEIPEIPGDIDHDRDVDFVDFALLAVRWLETGCGICNGSDLTNDGDVDLHDLREFAENWLAGVE
ncbi:hypothetical protein ACFL5Z_16140 [Planctomycetota bacterium]